MKIILARIDIRVSRANLWDAVEWWLAVIANAVNSPFR